MSGPAEMRAGAYSIGVALVLLAATLLSTGGLFLRHMEAATPWQVLFYRSGAMAVVTLAVIAVQYRGKLVAPFRRMGAGGLFAAATLGVSMIGYVFAVMLTTVANAMFVISSAPFFAASSLPCSWSFPTLAVTSSKRWRSPLFAGSSDGCARSTGNSMGNSRRGSASASPTDSFSSRWSDASRPTTAGSCRSPSS